MIVVRTVIQAQFGKGGEVAANMAQSIGGMMDELGQHRKWRVMTDLSGPFDTVVLEVDANDLAEWERIRPKLFQTKAFGESMGRVQGMLASGRNEFYTVEGEG
jgi:hypothetical protein